MFSQSYIVTPEFCAELHEQLDTIGNDFENSYECEYRFSELYIRADESSKAELLELGYFTHSVASHSPEAFASEAGESKNL